MLIFLAQIADEVSGVTDSIERLRDVGSFTLLAVVILAVIVAAVVISGRVTGVRTKQVEAETEEAKAHSTTVTTLSSTLTKVLEEASANRTQLANTQQELVQVAKGQAGSLENVAKHLETMQKSHLFMEGLYTTAMKDIGLMQRSIGAFESEDETIAGRVHQIAADLVRLLNIAEERQQLDTETDTVLTLVKDSLAMVKTYLEGTVQSAKEATQDLPIVNLKENNS